MTGRIKVLLIFFYLLFFFVLVKLFYWQIIKEKWLTSLANFQYQGERVVSGQRGKIFSSDRFPLVLNKGSFLLYANPQDLSIAPESLEKKLSSVLNKGVEVNKEMLLNKKLFWVSLLQGLDEEQKNNIEKLNINGLGFEKGEKRFYPEASSSAHFLGFVGVDDKGNSKGYFGLEGYYDEELKGIEGKKAFEQDAAGRPLPMTKETEEKSLPGRDLILNIDRSIQFFAEKYLIEGIKKTGAKSGLVLIMNPKNGAIIASASTPNYEPEKYFQYESEYYRNPVISSVFEPGSVFKVITMASAIDAGAVSKYETCSECSGPRQIFDYTIKTWNEKYYPNSTMTDILIHSDNVGMVYVVKKLGLKKFISYIKKFGFGDVTEIDLQGEINPQIKPENDWHEIDLATSSFGQGIAVTPVQILSAVSAIANKGELYQPQVVKSIIENEREIIIKPVKKRTVISSQTAQVISGMMEQVVEKSNVKKLKPSGYRIAGKSGTAQIPVAGRYDENSTITSYVGFAPAGDPKFAMLVTLFEPKLSEWSEATAAPLWFEIAKEIIRLWDIKPTL